MKPEPKFTPPELCFDAGVSQCQFYDSWTIRCTRYNQTLKAGANYYIRLPCASCIAARKGKGAR